ncbi:DNA-directed RNA polymerase specialized sigma subunit [Aeromonas hydrophila]|uniref:NIPSNAP family protein n=1 Tax=Aeromonas hydrophila TaxID=644 RepID=UPI002168E0CB|nr:NIPSNAP family protein [Aeromonas hydrophila]MCS3769226.1 DNA-directed RNA polymerase specialized sigma subunit [Aeromonas hydrophila]
MKSVEFLQYKLHPGTGEDFHHVMKQISIPLHESVDIDVVAYGQSEHDLDSYILIRAFDSLEEREDVLNKFYFSDAWREGPREEIIACISTSLTSILHMNKDAVEALRNSMHISEKNK